MMRRNKFRTEDHEILGANAQTSVPSGTGAQDLGIRGILNSNGLTEFSTFRINLRASIFPPLQLT